tara:strand:+ start:1236 stop:1703 length:468 start_codon:yes stop_codon:yes gene_type:complete
MALKPDRIESHTDISFFMNAVAERGGVAVAATGAANSNTGASMDDAGASVEYAVDPSGRAPIGVLLNDVKDYDLTKQHINWYKDEVQKGGKVTLLRQGQVTTDVIASVTPKAGETAYVAANGNLSNAQAAGASAVGMFLSGKDSDGYAKVDINIS